ncbi:hypothetical protein LQW54_012294 [Pestalotiopsis sp. IQ-011]
MAATVDQKLLRATKFPPEFNTKVDMQKVNLQVMKKWIAGKLAEILGAEDDVITELCFNLIEGSRYPDIKSMQIQLTGFLEKKTALFCKELWNLFLSAQSSPQGVPQELLEAKKLELIQEKLPRKLDFGETSKIVGPATSATFETVNAETGAFVVVEEATIGAVADEEGAAATEPSMIAEEALGAAEIGRVHVHPRGVPRTVATATDMYPKTMGVAIAVDPPLLIAVIATITITQSRASTSVREGPHQSQPLQGPLRSPQTVKLAEPQ